MQEYCTGRDCESSPFFTALPRYPFARITPTLGPFWTGFDVLFQMVFVCGVERMLGLHCGCKKDQCDYFILFRISL